MKLVKRDGFKLIFMTSHMTLYIRVIFKQGRVALAITITIEPIELTI